MPLMLLLRPLAALNTWVLRLCRHLSWMALALMVLVILTQVVFRYVLNNALAWPDEAARFLMLWMAGLMAPSAMRWSGFVAIDMLPSALPDRAAKVLLLVLLLMSLGVLIVAVGHGYNHTFGFGGRFASSSLRLPLDWFGGEAVKVQLKYMYGALFTCVVLLISVTIELILRNLAQLFDPEVELPGDDALPFPMESE